MSRPLPRAILFDLDDTLLDDTGSVQHLWHEVTRTAAKQIPERDAEELLAEIERIRVHYWSDTERHRVGRQDLRSATRHIVASAFDSLGLDRRELAHWLADEYRDRRDQELCLFPEAVATLERVRRAGVGTALLTNGSSSGQRAKLERFDLARHFDHIFIEGEFGTGKPNPSVYLAALAALGVGAAQAWMVGDNLEWDVAAPQRLGVHGIWVDRQGRGLPPGSPVRPDRIIRQIGEI